MIIYTKILSTSVLASIKHVVSFNEIHAVDLVSLDKDILHCALQTCVSTVFGGFIAQDIWLGSNHIADAASSEHSAGKEIDLVINKLKNKGCSAIFLLGVFGGLPEDPKRGYNLELTMNYLDKLRFKPHLDIKQTTAQGSGFYFDIYSLMSGIISVSMWPCKDAQGNRKPAIELEPIFTQDLKHLAIPLSMLTTAERLVLK